MAENIHGTEVISPNPNAIHLGGDDKNKSKTNASDKVQSKDTGQKNDDSNQSGKQGFDKTTAVDHGVAFDGAHISSTLAHDESHQNFVHREDITSQSTPKNISQNEQNQTDFSHQHTIDHLHSSDRPVENNASHHARAQHEEINQRLSSSGDHNEEGQERDAQGGTLDWAHEHGKSESSPGPMSASGLNENAPPSHKDSTPTTEKEAHGKTPHNHGPKDVVHGPKDAVHGPKDTVHGPKDAVHGPKDAVHGPKDAVHGPKDVVHGPKDEAILHGWIGKQTLNGSAGNDKIYVGIGNQVLKGGKGDDKFFVSDDSVHGKYAITIRGGGGNDWLNLSSIEGKAFVTFADGSKTTLDLNHGGQMHLSGNKTGGTIAFDSGNKSTITFDHIEKLVF